MAKLAEMGSLKLSKLQLLVIDCSIDVKNRCGLNVSFQRLVPTQWLKSFARVNSASQHL